MVEDINQMSGFFAIKVIIGGMNLIAAGGSQYCLAGRKQAGFTAVFFMRINIMTIKDIRPPKIWLGSSI